MATWLSWHRGGTAVLLVFHQYQRRDLSQHSKPCNSMTNALSHSRLLIEAYVGVPTGGVGGD